MAKVARIPLPNSTTVAYFSHVMLSYGSGLNGDTDFFTFHSVLHLYYMFWLDP
jgi:hypothetical protein